LRECVFAYVAYASHDSYIRMRERERERGGGSSASITHQAQIRRMIVQTDDEEGGTGRVEAGQGEGGEEDEGRGREDGEEPW